MAETTQQLRDNLRFADAAIKDGDINIEQTRLAIEVAKKQLAETQLKVHNMKVLADTVSIEEFKAQNLSLFQIADVISTLQSNLAELIQKKEGIEAFVKRATEAIEAIEQPAPEPVCNVYQFPHKLSASE